MQIPNVIQKNAGTLTWLFALALASPLLFFSLPPGADTGWHVAIVELLAGSDSSVVFEERLRWGPYVAVYMLLSRLAPWIGAVSAVNVLLATSTFASILFCDLLLRAFNKPRVFVFCMMPVVYSCVLAFGFIVYLPSVALGLATWAYTLLFIQDTQVWKYQVVALCCFCMVCIVHPFAAVFVFGGSILMLLLYSNPQKKMSSAVFGLLLSLPLYPLLLSLRAMSQVEQKGVMPLLEHANFWTKLRTQRFVAWWESLSAAPVRLTGWLEPSLRYFWFMAILGLLVALRKTSMGMSDKEEQRKSWLFLVVLIVVYLLTPYTFEWPRNWYCAQPRLLPMIFAVLVVCLSPKNLSSVGKVCVVSFGLCSFLVFSFLVWLPHQNEAHDLKQILTGIPFQSKVLALVEDKSAIERRAPSFTRHAGGFAMAFNASYASHLPFAERSGINTGNHIPVALSEKAGALPMEPWSGHPRTFRWDMHSQGWSHILIRDFYKEKRFQYFTGNERHVELLSMHSNWRLFRVKNIQR